MPRFIFSAAPDQMMVDCLNAQLDTLRHSAAVVGTQLPAIPEAPDWYQNFFGSWAQVSSHAQEWVRSRVPEIQAVPQQIMVFANAFGSAQPRLNALLDQLKTDPQNSATRQSMVAELSGLTDAAKTIAADATAMSNGVTDYGNSLGPDHAILGNAAADALASVHEDQAAIAAVNAQIVALRSDINTYNRWLDLARYEFGAGVVITLIGVIATDPAVLPPPLNTQFGGCVIGLGVTLATASAVAVIVLESKIRAAQNGIVTDSDKLGPLQRQVLALNAFASQADELAAATAQSSTQVSQIQQAWSAIAADTAAVQTALADADRDLNAGEIAQLQQDIGVAASHWQDLNAIATKLSGITVSVSTELHPIGG